MLKFTVSQLGKTYMHTDGKSAQEYVCWYRACELCTLRQVARKTNQTIPNHNSTWRCFYRVGVDIIQLLVTTLEKVYCCLCRLFNEVTRSVCYNRLNFTYSSPTPSRRGDTQIWGRVTFWLRNIILLENNVGCLQVIQWTLQKQA